MSKKRILYILLFLTLSAFTFVAKSNFTELVDEKLNTYANINTPEKLYLHTDKPYYSLEDDLWFTAYLVNGITHEKSLKSWVINVELISEKNIIVASKKLFTSNINVAGDFKIDKNWKPGKYQLRAYTNYMQNDTSKTFFEKYITILDVKTAEANFVKNEVKTVNTVKNTKPDVGFYPEGGELVEGIRSKIVVKTKNTFTDNVTGKIVDNNNNKISNFTIADRGLGQFMLNAEPNKSYKAVININGNTYTYPIQKALPTGHVLSLVNTKSHIIINAKSNHIKGLNNTYLVVHQRGKLIYSKYAIDDKNNYTIKLPIQSLKDGVIHTTLFNAEGNPVSERLSFVSNPKNKATVNIVNNTRLVSKRKQVKLNLNVKDNAGNQLPSKLSISVRDLGLYPYNKKSKNIKTWLLLNSDLRGEIKNPGYFFDGAFSPKKQYLLDLTMLTNGWRRFTWQDLLYNTKKSPKFNAEKGLTISGTTKNLTAPYKAVQTNTRITFMGEKIQQQPVTKTDDKGRFSYGPFIFYDSVPTLIESRFENFKNNGIKNRQITISLNRLEAIPEIKKAGINGAHIINKKQLDNFIKVTKYIEEINLEFNKRTQLLNEIIVKANKRVLKTEREKEILERTNYPFANQRIDLEGDDSIIGSSIIDLLNTIPRVVALENQVSIRGNNGPPQIVLDGLNIDVDFLSTLDATDISFIDVLEGANASQFSNSGNGIIALYSKTGRAFYNDVKRKPGIVDFSAQGFYTARKFFSPDHINGFEELTKADARTTLYWNPIVETKNNGNSEIIFFSSDAESDYLIEVQGITTTGIPVHGISTFSVN